MCWTPNRPILWTYRDIFHFSIQLSRVILIMMFFSLEKILWQFLFSNLIRLYLFVGVMQATTMSGSKLEKRYSPSFHEDSNRKQSASKRKRDDVLRLVFFQLFYYLFQMERFFRPHVLPFSHFVWLDHTIRFDFLLFSCLMLVIEQYFFGLTHFYASFERREKLWFGILTKDD